MDTPTPTPPPKNSRQNSPLEGGQGGVLTRTTLGTPCAKSWDAAWIERINERESTYNRPICGARTRNDTPCSMAPSHENGRCKFHGGFPLTGAPKGNRNAVLHGLYSRRLQLCGEHCPQWNSCPLGGKAVAAMPYKERPHCPYEQAEYNAVLTDLIRRIGILDRPNPSLKHLAHQVALMQVMTSRAAAALRSRPLTETTTTSTENYSAEYTKVSASLQAFTRIAAEFRRFHHLLEQEVRNGPWPWESNATREREAKSLTQHAHRLEHDTDPHPDAQAALHRTPETMKSETAAFETAEAPNNGLEQSIKQVTQIAKEADEAWTEGEGILEAMRANNYQPTEEMLADNAPGDMRPP